MFRERVGIERSRGAGLLEAALHQLLLLGLEVFDGDTGAKSLEDAHASDLLRDLRRLFGQRDLDDTLQVRNDDVGVQMKHRSRALERGAEPHGEAAARELVLLLRPEEELAHSQEVVRRHVAAGRDVASRRHDEMQRRVREGELVHPHTPLVLVIYPDRSDDPVPFGIEVAEGALADTIAIDHGEILLVRAAVHERENLVVVETLDAGDVRSLNCCLQSCSP